MTSPQDEAHKLRTRQLWREKTQRETASGQRARRVLRGDLGPVLKRWVSATIVPVAARLVQLCNACVGGDADGAASLAASPVFGLPAFTESKDLHAILRWAAKGDLADDLVLAVLGTVIKACASSEDPVPLTRMVTASANAARETALGQFLTQVQGAKAMMRVRGQGKPGWRQAKTLHSVGAFLAGQVRSSMAPEPSGTVPTGGREVVSVQFTDGERRHIELRRPEPGDWALLEVARRVKGERDAQLSTWCSFAMLVLCCAQAEAGWFDLVKIKPTRPSNRRGPQSALHGIVLSPEATRGVKGDLDRWLIMGFSQEPMLSPPDKGDYLSVKHREVTGGRGPLGMKTSATDTAAWAAASSVIAGTQWTVPSATLAALRDSEFVQELAKKSEPDDTRRELLLTAYRRVAAEPFYLPILMDFRGRVYTRGHEVTYQGRDMQKGLLCFPEVRQYPTPAVSPFIRHCAGLYGASASKASPAQQQEWWLDMSLDDETSGWLDGADQPIQLFTAMKLWAAGQTDRVACQIDGTCNGLQHLTAMFRDDVAAPWVNLTASNLEHPPLDLYARVAEEVSQRLATIAEPWARRLLATVKVDRKLCKRPVMVLPYGAVKTTVEDIMLEGILAQSPDPLHWTVGMDVDGFAYADWLAGDYSAFHKRELADHPLLRLDSQRLGGLVWDAIVAILPRPMQAMQAFRDIAKYVGKRTIEWQTGFSYGDHPPLWVVQARAKSDRTGLKFKGLELPGSVRGLKIRPGRDEIDAHAHVTGMVANFVHSQDAAHLARTAHYFFMAGGVGLGAIHDCLLARPSQMGVLGKAVRAAFAQQYAEDPLLEPVRLRDPLRDTLETFPSWYALAAQAGAAFPDRGTWMPDEVFGSAWFFS